MLYKKLKTANSIIEYHMNWLGVETIIIGGQIISKKASLTGATHYFTIFENGHAVPHILTTNIGSKGRILIDLRREGELIEKDVHIKFGSKKDKEVNLFKVKGIKFVNEYEIDQALVELKKALDFDRKDPEVYFFLACCYSIKEQVEEGYDSLRNAVKYHLNDIEMILNHEMLAYLRIQDSFEEFFDSNFTKYEV